MEMLALIRIMQSTAWPSQTIFNGCCFLCVFFKLKKSKSNAKLTIRISYPFGMDTIDSKIIHANIIGIKDIVI